ncbi:UNVERIFIED_CONTAM: hypothetical protein FKN15_036496 [Acipenser sinensis]
MTHFCSLHRPQECGLETHVTASTVINQALLINSQTAAVRIGIPLLHCLLKLQQDVIQTLTLQQALYSSGQESLIVAIDPVRL